MSGGPSGSTTSSGTSTSEPWSGQQPFLTQGFEEAKRLLESDKPGFFPGSTVVPFSPETQTALAMRTRNALGGGGGGSPGGVSDLFPGARFLPSGGGIPFFQGAGTRGQRTIANPAIARLQAQIDKTAPTLTTAASGTSPAQGAAQLSGLRSELAAAERGLAIADVSGEGNALGLEGEQANVDRIKKQIAALSAGQADFVPESTAPNPEVARLQRVLEGLTPTIDNPEFVPNDPLRGGVPGGGVPGGGGGAGRAGESLIGLAESETGRTLRGDYLRPDNPVFQGMLQGINDLVRPGVDASFAGAGRNAGPGASPVRGELLARGITTGMLPFLQAERGRQQGAVTRAGAVSEMAPSLLESVGRTREGLSRNVLQEELDRFNFGQNVEASKLREFMQNVTGNYGGTTKTTSTQPLFSNPLMTGLGAASSIAGIGSSLFAPAGGGGMLAGKCWVAREVYGMFCPKWVWFRTWLLDRAPAWFRWLYLRHGQAFAGWLRGRPRLKAPIRLWMDSRIQEA